MAFLEGLFDPVFAPLLGLNAVWVILIISLLISVIMTLIYKFMTDQHVMKDLKGQLKKYQAEMKNLRDNPSKMMETQKKAMSINMEYMKHSFKPMIFSFLPIIIIFGWLSGNLAFEPLMPGETFEVSAIFQPGVSGNASIIAGEGLAIVGDNTSSIVDHRCKSFLWFKKDCKKADFKLEAEAAGEFEFEVLKDDAVENKRVLITTEQDYLKPEKLITGNAVFSSIEVHNKPIKAIRIGGFGLNWFWTYFLFSIVFSTLLRKLLKLH